MPNKQSIRELLGRTAQRIETQDFLPRSPGVLVGDEPVFCSGAAFIIYEAVQTSLTPAASRKLALDLLANGKSGLVQKAAKFNLNVALVERAISMNDSFSDDERKSRMSDAILKLETRSESSFPG
jgi:hypothetical protein